MTALNPRVRLANFDVCACDSHRQVFPWVHGKAHSQVLGGRGSGQRGQQGTMTGKKQAHIISIPLMLKYVGSQGRCMLSGWETWLITVIMPGFPILVGFSGFCFPFTFFTIRIPTLPVVALSSELYPVPGAVLAGLIHMYPFCHCSSAIIEGHRRAPKATP